MATTADSYTLDYFLAGDNMNKAADGPLVESLPSSVRDLLSEASAPGFVTEARITRGRMLVVIVTTCLLLFIALMYLIRYVRRRRRTVRLHNNDHHHHDHHDHHDRRRRPNNTSNTSNNPGSR
jgi:hypothetical protein